MHCVSGGITEWQTASSHAHFFSALKLKQRIMGMDRVPTVAKKQNPEELTT